MPWAPGQSGNPGGRPKTKVVSDLIKARLARIPADDPRTDAERLADVIVDGALGGDIQFIRELLNRVEGKVAEMVITESGPEQTVIDALEILRERKRGRTG